MGKVRDKVGHVLVMVNNGRFLVGIVQFALSFAILLKVFNLPTWWNAITIPGSIIVTWALGWLYERLGLRKAYETEAARYVIASMKEKEK